MTLGIAMVEAFSLGLAATLVSVGLVAAWGVRRASGWSGFAKIASTLPYVSASLVFALGGLMALRGIADLWLA